MTESEKNYIIQERQKGRSCAELAGALGLSVNTVKSFCRRNRVPVTGDETGRKTADTSSACCFCGALIEQLPHRKIRRFCSDACRLNWWHAHRDMEKKAEERRCLHCGKVFRSAGERKYCCRACYFEARYGRKKEDGQR